MVVDGYGHILVWVSVRAEDNWTSGESIELYKVLLSYSCYASRYFKIDISNICVYLESASRNMTGMHDISAAQHP